VQPDFDGVPCGFLAIPVQLEQSIPTIGPGALKHFEAVGSLELKHHDMPLYLWSMYWTFFKMATASDRRC